MYVPLDESLPAEHRWQFSAFKTRLLLVDADDHSRAETAEILQLNGYKVEQASGGQEALEWLKTETFEVLLADLLLPDISGFELMKRALALNAQLPVILTSRFGDFAMAQRALTQGAADYIAKPYPQACLPAMIEQALFRRFLETRREREHKVELQQTYRSLIEALLLAVDLRDSETEGHSERVAAYTLLMAQEMGVSDEELLLMERGALLHDIGKLGVPDRILLKPGKLDEAEWAIMRQHPQIGYNLCKKIPSLEEASLLVLHHHERFDGEGYPHKLKGEEIPLGARIFALVDTLDAMTSDRPYRKALSFEEAAKEIVACAGKQFDPYVVNVFRSIPLQAWKALRENIANNPIKQAA